MHRVEDGLYVGGIEAAADGAILRAAGIRTVVALTHTEPTGGYPDEVYVVREPVRDGPDHDGVAFERAVAATRRALVAGEPTLVHCSAGSSRSVTVAATALACATDRDLDGAVRSSNGGRRPTHTRHCSVGRRRCTRSVGRIPSRIRSFVRNISFYGVIRKVRNLSGK
ncbi:protein phosphatase [Halobacteriales archaeon QS_4_70_19]|nr:MAG: protein phosphatase [Halobacteriales archaeon QS_4_70_19]